jgi:hypothetical protein
MFRRFKKTAPIVPIIDLSVVDDVHQMLDPCPEEGQGVNFAVLGAARTLYLLGYRTQEEVWPMIEQWAGASVNQDRLRHIMTVELPRAWNKAQSDTAVPESYSTKPKEKWHLPETEEVFEFAKEWGANSNQWESITEFNRSSPIDLNVLKEEYLSTSDWLHIFFQDDDWLCLAPESWGTEIKPLKDWDAYGINGRYGMRYFTPNPFQPPYTFTRIPGLALHITPKRNDESVKHTRKYIVTEMDIALQDKKGRPSKWAPLLQREGILAFDIQSAILRYLQSLKILTLHSVVWSGTKSLHGLWGASDPDTNKKFFHGAVAHGVDRCHWSPSQLARCYVPKEQPLLYLDLPN